MKDTYYCFDNAYDLLAKWLDEDYELVHPVTEC